MGGGLDSAGVDWGGVKPEREGCAQQGAGELPLLGFLSPPEAAVGGASGASDGSAHRRTSVAHDGGGNRCNCVVDVGCA